MIDEPIAASLPLHQPHTTALVSATRRLSWPAIFAGLFATMALEVLFVLLGSALGFAIFSPLTDPNPASNFGTGAAVIEGVSAVVSLWFGGWVAGRLAPTASHATGWLHGFIVWCAATVVAVVAVSSGAGTIFSGVGRMTGGALAMVGKPMATAASQAPTADTLQHSKSTVASFADEAASGSGPNAGPAANIRTRRDVGLALGRLFDPAQKANMADNRAAASKVLVDDAGMTPADADRKVNEWSATYDQLQHDVAVAKDEAEAKAREAANEASKDLAVISGCAFVAFLLGAAAATTGATHGLHCAYRHETEIQAA